MRITRRAALAAFAALLPGAARARIYADTVNMVGESLDEIRAKGRLKVAVYEDFAPFSAARRRDNRRHAEAQDEAMDQFMDVSPPAQHPDHADALWSERGLPGALAGWSGAPSPPSQVPPFTSSATTAVAVFSRSGRHRSAACVSWVGASIVNLGMSSPDQCIANDNERIMVKKYSNYY